MLKWTIFQTVPLYFMFCFCEVVDHIEYCSFFQNRAPTPQPNLKNCTWFKENSCCQQEEIDATFGGVKPLLGASQSCQRYTNYLMCYICAPYQSIFYSRERLAVCEEFCNVWFEACGSAVLKGSIISHLYTNGRDFCKSRSYEVDTMVNNKCFFFDSNLDRKSSAVSIKFQGILTVVMMTSSILLSF
ncbi:hypothetical protein CHS0354_008027 [Potamilus streckersoni]|uniref:Folate receptor-like domain-containing protein n=1 Tax=Potamilus streckersoni TaxID=2493646 RepID=A0AAE0RMF3_9BIVA|nr:hypothetical protein CHS0354_008027 [Potamilus streckersoni]